LEQIFEFWNKIFSRKTGIERIVTKGIDYGNQLMETIGIKEKNDNLDDIIYIAAPTCISFAIGCSFSEILTFFSNFIRK